MHRRSVMVYNSSVRTKRLRIFSHASLVSIDEIVIHGYWPRSEAIEIKKDYWSFSKRKREEETAKETAIKLGSIYGIPLYLDYSWFIILALLVWTVGFWMMPSIYPGISFWTELALGLLSAFLLFVSILVHELAHSIVAKRNGLKIGKITLYLLGGFSEMTEEPSSASLEFRMSIAGPLTSLAIAAGSFGAWVASAYLRAPVLVQGPLDYSFIFNLVVAAFNLIPAFPLDGGRVLRSLLWRRNSNMIRSTKMASTVGRFFGYAMVLGGVAASFLYSPFLFEGLWFVLIGWFVSSGAQNEYRQTLIMRDIAGVKAEDIMTRTIDKVEPDATLTELSSRFLQYKHSGLPVMTGNELVGCVTMSDLKRVKKQNWDTTTVRSIMTPREGLVTVKESEPAKRVFELMGRNPTGRLFVLSENETPAPAESATGFASPSSTIVSGRIVGVITRTDIVRTIQMQESHQRSESSNLPPAGTERNVSAEVGMLFELVSPPELGVDSSAYFSPGEFYLMSDVVVQVQPDRQTRQFTFQALRKGTFSIWLVKGQLATQPQIGRDTPLTAVASSQPPKRGNSLKYTIVVS